MVEEKREVVLMKGNEAIALLILAVMVKNRQKNNLS